jgi:hypothetical protein
MLVRDTRRFPNELTDCPNPSLYWNFFEFVAISFLWTAGLVGILDYRMLGTYL